MQNNICVHTWQPLSTHYEFETRNGNTRYTRLDIFFCQKCLEEKSRTLDEYDLKAPLWWKHEKGLK